ncbi:hypothetical protein F8388_005031 [Cannabis sativa]|uniref:Alcohol dehydrogenase-like C-terminal domain-containing protein n=1 Tax=Cannabis sativa TaxID=3483 RepID=A0A7J6E6X1_CANSA|nr:hypothetical protein F8388_005031 [Cannabis sativa]
MKTPKLAKHVFGASKVAATASTAKLELLKRLGADWSIDYTKENVEEIQEKFDVVYDTVGQVEQGLKVVKEGGKIVSISKPAVGAIFYGKVTWRNWNLTWRMVRFKAVIDPKGLLPFANTMEAFAYLETSRATGKARHTLLISRAFLITPIHFQILGLGVIRNRNQNVVRTMQASVPRSVNRGSYGVDIDSNMFGWRIPFRVRKAVELYVHKLVGTRSRILMMMMITTNTIGCCCVEKAQESACRVGRNLVPGWSQKECEAVAVSGLVSRVDCEREVGCEIGQFFCCGVPKRDTSWYYYTPNMQLVH